MDSKKKQVSVSSILAGGSAGLSVDIALFPLDTLKTRLQSAVGFRASGGFRNIYSGLGPAALGSAPNAAAFFFTYENVKLFLKEFNSQYEFCNHAASASAGEVVACIVRVPTEVLKQRHQANPNLSTLSIVRGCLRGGLFEFYRGYWSTVAREIPFSFIQYPLWEGFKKLCLSKDQSQVTSWQSALSGSLAGGIAAMVTTPLDVAKTRIMLAHFGTEEAKGKILFIIKRVYKSNGLAGLFAGVIPRCLWMSLGGAIYFGVYEFVRNFADGM